MNDSYSSPHHYGNIIKILLKRVENDLQEFGFSTKGSNKLGPNPWKHATYLWTHRKKELIITSGGRNISPQKIENLLKSYSLIHQIFLYGDSQNFYAVRALKGLLRSRLIQST
jgi:acyl-CoA synthetase (AMP-forming)/AMP-acid ligase II